MSEPKYRDWILDTIDSLRSRKARPDLERICRMVRRRHGLDPDRTRAELERLIQGQTVLKVSYKGSISYRNAARVQRKSRKKSELTPERSSSGSGSGGSPGEAAKPGESLTDQEDSGDKDPPTPAAAGNAEGPPPAPGPDAGTDPGDAAEETCEEPAPKAELRPAAAQTPDLGDRLVASVRSLAAGSRGSGPAPLGLREVLAHLSAHGGPAEETLTRGRVRAVLEREVARGRLRRTRFGHIALAAAERRRSPAAEQEEVKVDELMETDDTEEEEQKMEVDAEGAPHADGPVPCVRETEVKGDNEAPPTTECGPNSDAPQVQPRLSEVTVKPELQAGDEGDSNPGVQAPQSARPSEQETATAGSEVTETVTMADVPDPLSSDTPDQVATAVAEGILTSSQTDSVCKVEVGVSSCLLTPTASPRDTSPPEERGMNGGLFVKSESSSLNPADWTVADVVRYFTAAGFPEQAVAFRTQEIDGKSLLLMQRNDVLTGLSIRLGPALKIYERHVKVLQQTHFQDDEDFC